MSSASPRPGLPVAASARSMTFRSVMAITALTTGRPLGRIDSPVLSAAVSVELSACSRRSSKSAFIPPLPISRSCRSSDSFSPSITAMPAMGSSEASAARSSSSVSST